MHSTPRRRPSVEVLESRHLPATFGVPWPEPQSLTLSFMPDGTPVSGATSSLSQTLNATMPTQTWELEILRAFQSWAVLGNINIGVVADDGQAPGQPGPLQGNSGFGDIRIGARPLSAGTLALSSPFDLTNDWSGVVLLNSQARYGNGSNGTESLFNAVLHEAGHIFGLPDNPNDPLGAMFPLNTMVHTAPDAAEAAMIRAQYGARPASNPLGNTTLATASPIRFVAAGSTAGVVSATLESETDDDVYRVTDNAPGGTFAVDLQTSGISLLTARVTVENASGQVVATAAAPDALHGNIALTVPGAVKGASYFIKVQGTNADVFAIGSYRLAVGAAKPAANAVAANPAAVTVTGHTTFGTAQALTPQTPGTDARWPYLVQGTLATPTTTQYFAIQDKATSAPALLVTVWANESNRLAPKVVVLDASDHPVASRVVSQDASSETIEVLSPTPGARYVVVVSAADPTGARSQAVGDYTLATTFPSAAIAPSPTLASGTLDAAAPATTLTLNVIDSEVFHLDLNLNSGATPNTAVSAAIFNVAGKAVEQLIAQGKAGSASGDVVLPAGHYTIRIIGYATRTPGAPASSTVSYDLLGTNRSQPIGPTPTDPTLDPVGTPADSSPSTPENDVVVDPFCLSDDLLTSFSMVLIDPFGDLVWD